MATDALLDAARERLAEFGIKLTFDLDLDAVAVLSRAKASARYHLAVTDHMTLSSLAPKLSRSSRNPLLVIGERVTPRSAASFRRAGVQFIDALGNAFISFGGVLVEVQGRSGPTAPAPEDNRRANLFSARRAQVIFALLAWPELATANVRDIAHAAGTSVGQAHDTLAQLQQAGFFIPATRRLTRSGELLDYWTAAYPTGLSRRLELAHYHGDPSKPVKMANKDQRIYLSGESAQGTEIARPATMTMYADVLDPKLPIINRWTSSPEHPPNIFVRHKFWNTPPPGEPANAPWPLVYADLTAPQDARLNEVAKAWRTRFARSDEM